MAIEQQQRKNKSNEKAFFNESPAQKVSAGITTNGASPAGVAWAGSSKLPPSRQVSRIPPASRVSRRLPVSRPLPAYPAGFLSPADRRAPATVASLSLLSPAPHSLHPVDWGLPLLALPLRPPSPSYRRLRGQASSASWELGTSPPNYPSKSLQNWSVSPKFPPNYYSL